MRVAWEVPTSQALPGHPLHWMVRLFPKSLTELSQLQPKLALLEGTYFGGGPGFDSLGPWQGLSAFHSLRGLGLPLQLPVCYFDPYEATPCIWPVCGRI